MTKKKVTPVKDQKTPSVPILYKRVIVTSQSGMPVMEGRCAEDAITVKEVKDVTSVKTVEGATCYIGNKEDYAVPRHMILNVICEK